MIRIVTDNQHKHVNCHYIQNTHLVSLSMQINNVKHAMLAVVCRLYVLIHVHVNMYIPMCWPWINKTCHPMQTKIMNCKTHVHLLTRMYNNNYTHTHLQWRCIRTFVFDIYPMATMFTMCVQCIMKKSIDWTYCLWHVCCNVYIVALSILMGGYHVESKSLTNKNITAINGWQRLVQWLKVTRTQIQSSHWIELMQMFKQFQTLWLWPSRYICWHKMRTTITCVPIRNDAILWIDNFETIWSLCN